MPRRYICRDCKRINSRKKTCDFCGESMEVLEYDLTAEGMIPYALAGMAGLFLLLSYMLGTTVLIWFTFPLIAVGLILDHIFQEKLDRRAKSVLLKWSDNK
ncbi:MAG: hypothetical protein R6U17_05740 [Thermoplasmata archaeon]